jgi:uncharacterized membrane protein YidH (DUF202 family)
MDSLLWGILGYVIFPFWLGIGLLDLALHQRTHIAATSGAPESALHLVQTAQNGIPVLIVLFLEINALALLIIAVCVVAHTLTAYVDIAYTATRRHISPFEQFVHAFMIVLPILALLLLTILHWDEAREMADPAAAPSRAWAIGLRQTPHDASLVAVILVSSGLFALVPALAEFLQTWRAARARSASHAGVEAGSQPGR